MGDGWPVWTVLGLINIDAGYLHLGRLGLLRVCKNFGFGQLRFLIRHNRDVCNEVLRRDDIFECAHICFVENAVFTSDFADFHGVLLLYFLDFLQLFILLLYLLLTNYLLLRFNLCIKLSDIDLDTFNFLTIAKVLNLLLHLIAELDIQFFNLLLHPSITHVLVLI